MICDTNLKTMDVYAVADGRVVSEGVPHKGPEPEPELAPDDDGWTMVRPVSISLGADELTGGDGSGSSSDDDEAEEANWRLTGGPHGAGDEAFGVFASLDDAERAQLEAATSQPLSDLVPTSSARLGLAADVRCAVQRAFAQDVDLALLTMTQVCRALELTPSEVTFFSDISAAWPTEDAAPLGVHLEEPAPPLLPTELRWPALIGSLRLLSAANDGGGVVVYDARHRALLRHLALSYGVGWEKVRAAETARLAELYETHAPPSTT